MSDGVIIALIPACASLLLAIVNALVAWLQRREQKKNRTEERIESIEKKVDKLTEHNELQYMALLRLTVMDSDMPMSERLIAGKDYLNRDGNGDVRKFYVDLERTVNSHDRDE